MSVRERNGKWHIDFYVGQKRYRFATALDATRSNLHLAETIESRQRLAIVEGQWGIRRLTPRAFNEAATEFLEWNCSESRDHPATHRRIATSFASLQVHFSDAIVSTIGPSEINAYKTWRREHHGVREITIRHDLHALSSFFQWAMGKNYARENPVRSVSIPSDKDAVRMHVLTPAEERQFFRFATGDIADLCRLIVNQGCRPEELTALPKKNIDLHRRVLRITRGKTPAARRELTLTDESLSILARRLKGPSKWLFPTAEKKKRKGKRHLDTHVIKLNNAFDAILKAIHDSICECDKPSDERGQTDLVRKAGSKWRSCPATPRYVIYDFRHTFATRLAEDGVPLPSLAAILGHSDVRSVMKYVHPTRQHQHEAMLQYSAARSAAQKESVQ